MYQKICTHCKKEYVTDKYRTKYCDTTCKKDAYKVSALSPEGKEKRLRAKRKWRETKGSTPEYKKHEAKLQSLRRAKNPEKFRHRVWVSKLKNNYGLTPEKYKEMLEEQDNRCKICKEIFIVTANVDHCHTTGKVRGLLCGNCNHGLGKFKDNTKHLQNAIIYLQETRDCL